MRKIFKIVWNFLEMKISLFKHASAPSQNVHKETPELSYKLRNGEAELQNKWSGRPIYKNKKVFHLFY
jgi:hypothetical protein